MARRGAKFPEPPSPAELAAISPEPRPLPAGTELWRVYVRGGPYPGRWNEFRAYGPVRTARFDHHAPPPRMQARRILYAATHGPTGIAEVFQATRLVDTVRNEPWLVGFALARPLGLLDLAGPWITAAGASQAVSSGPRGRARRWSAAIYAAYPEIDGLWYPSSMYAGTHCLALYERAESALPETPFFHRPLADPAMVALLRHVCRRITYRLR